MEISIRWSLCRVCASDHSSDLHSLHSPDNVTAVIHLRTYAGLEVKPADGLPDKICSDCLDKLDLVHKFLDKCKQSNEYLKNLVLCTMSASLVYQSTNKKEDTREIIQTNSIKFCDAKTEQRANADTAGVFLIDRKDQTKLESQSTDGDCSSIDNTTSDLRVISKQDIKMERQSPEGERSSIEYSSNAFGLPLRKQAKSERQSQEDCDGSSNDNTTDFLNLIPEAVTLPSDLVDLGAACEPANYQFHFNCAKCDNWFQNEKQLLVHLRSHRKEKSYECELCSKRFNAASNLTTHMRTHTGEKPFGCTFCGRTFADRSTLRKHERTHTKERPYACSICGKTFSLSTSLKAHFLSHSGEKPHKCLTCNKGFRLPHQLKAHQKSHAHRQELGLLDEEADFSSP